MMKNIISLGIILCISASSFAQWTNTANPTTTGKVGIGSSTASTYPLSFYSGLANTKIALWDDGTANIMGIGVQAAQFRLHLNTSASKFSFLANPTATSDIATIWGSGGAMFRLLGSSSFSLQDNNNVSLFSVDNYGNAVVNMTGSNNPYGAGFLVSSTGTVPGAIAMQGYDYYNKSISINIGIAATKAFNSTTNLPSGCSGCYSDMAVTGDAVVNLVSQNTNANLLVTNHSYQGSIKFTTKDITGHNSNGDKQRMEIKYDGKVVIGQPSDFTAAATPFPAGYNLYVSNGIISPRMKIGMPGLANWSDFVFEKDYKLRSLEEVEGYIQQNKHLPEIPSAAEVGAHGIDVAQMDALLLQKIEELTLYMIEMKKENTAIKKENEKILKEMEALRAKK